MWWLPDKTPIHLSKPTYYITSSRKPLWSLQIKLITPSSDLPLSRDYLHLYLLVWAMICLSKKLSPLRVTGSRIRPGVHANSLQSCLTLCNPMDYSLPGSSVHGILQARILERLPRPLPGDLPDPGIEPVSLISPALVDRLFTTSTTLEAWDQATTVQIPGLSFFYMGDFG